MQLDRVLAPISTPFGPDGTLDLDGLGRNLARYVREGLRGFVVAGSTGEAVFLNGEEKVRLFAAAAEGVRKAATSGAGDVLLVAGTAAESVRETVAVIREAAGLGYHAALVVTPYYYKAQMLRPETQETFFTAVADAAALPVLLYNFPQMTGIDLPVEVVARLAEHRNVAGIKDSSADLGRIRALLAAVPAGFPVLVGASATYDQSLALGARGGILALANMRPAETVAVHERFRRGDVEGAARQQRTLAEVASIPPRYGIQGLKYAMDLAGYAGGSCRLPLLPLSATQKQEIEALVGAATQAAGAGV